MIEWLYRLEQQGKLRVPTLGEVLAHCELPRGESFTPKPGEEGAIANFPRDSESCRSEQRAADRRDDTVMVTPSRDTVADSRSGPIALLRSIENLPDRQCDRNERENAPVEWSDPDEITLVSSECVAAPRFLTQDRVCEDESEPEEAHEIITRAEIHETSEKDQAEDGRQIIYIDIAAMSQENRFFVNVQVGKFTYRALMDSGAQCCLAGPKMMKDLAGRIRPSPTVIGFANSQDESSSGCLPVMLQVDREPGRVVFECVEILPVEMVLGADFGRRWRVDIGMGRDQWRSNDGPWHDFAKPSDTKMRNYAITAECAGITVKPSERELVLQKVMRLIPDVSGELGYTDRIKHKIELIEGARPVCQRARRMSDKMEKIAIEHVSKMLREGIIEEACSEWNSAPVIVKKSDGSHRFCVDYRDLNKVTKKDGYPCKNMDEILDKLRKARYISKIDLKSAYHQVLMEEEPEKLAHKEEEPEGTTAQRGPESSASLSGK
uniref:Reverse transcriptase domain-containing protein n=1 Tax=Trichogramma kaykai TaxID=54128 RepID=A0ABD2W563_9HYME